MNESIPENSGDVDAVPYVDGRPSYLDRSSQPMTLRQWGEMRRDPGRCLVASTLIGDAEVITTWIGIDPDPFNSSVPLIFGSIIRRKGEWGERIESSTEAEAMQAHLKLVHRVYQETENGNAILTEIAAEFRNAIFAILHTPGASAEEKVLAMRAFLRMTTATHEAEVEAMSDQPVTTLNLAFYGIDEDDGRLTELIDMIDRWADDNLGIEEVPHSWATHRVPIVVEEAHKAGGQG